MRNYELLNRAITLSDFIIVLFVLSSCGNANFTPPVFSKQSHGAYGLANSFLVQGSVVASQTSVSLFTTSDCTGTPVATGTAAQFASGIPVSVSSNSTVIYATATDGKTTSACSTDFASYKRMYWTWQAGGNAIPFAGSYGSLGVAASGNNPPPRSSASLSITPSQNFILFGGNSSTNYGDLNDLWQLSSTTNLWTWLGGTSGSNTSSGTSGSLGVAASTNAPGVRAAQGMWTLPNGSFYMFGGYDRRGSQQADLWFYNVNNGYWTWVSGPIGNGFAGQFGTQGVGSTTNYPPPRNSSITWTDANGNFWLFGGSGPAVSTDLWQFNPTLLTWTWMGSAGSQTNSNGNGIYGTQGIPSSSNWPGLRNSGCGWTAADGSLWLFGGQGLDSVGTNGQLNDLWRYDISTGQWTWEGGSNLANQNGHYGQAMVSASSNQPGSRHNANWWSDSQNRFWLYGGIGYDLTSGGAVELGDLWVFDPSTMHWTWVQGPSAGNSSGDYGTLQLSASTNLPGARDAGTTALDGLGNVWLYGGHGYDANGTAGALGDFWTIPVP